MAVTAFTLPVAVWSAAGPQPADAVAASVHAAAPAEAAARVVGGGQDEVALRLACAEFGDAGRVRFAGNLPHESEIVPLLIVIRLEEFDVPAATAIAFVFLLASFATLLVINVVSWRRGLAVGQA